MFPSTIEAIVKLLEFVASDDVTRPHMCAVQAQPLAFNKVRLVATDGHMMSFVIVVDEELFKNGECYFHRDQLPQIKIAAKTKIEYPVKDLCMKEYNVNFPKTNQYWPDPEVKGCFEIGLDANLLLELVKGITEHKKKTIVHLVFKDELSPIRVFAPNGNEGVLMPCRIEKKIKGKATLKAAK